MLFPFCLRSGWDRPVFRARPSSELTFDVSRATATECVAPNGLCAFRISVPHRSLCRWIEQSAGRISRRPRAFATVYYNMLTWW